MSNKLLHIDTDLQIPNRILKNDTNKVKQITDKAQNIAFTQSDSSKQPIYNYDGCFKFDGINDSIYSDFNINLPQSDGITICFKFKTNTTAVRNLFVNHTIALSGWYIQVNNEVINIYDGSRTWQLGANFIDTSLEKIHTVIIQLKDNGDTICVFDNVVGFMQQNNYGGLLSSENIAIIGAHQNYSAYNFNGDLFYFHISKGVRLPALFNKSPFDSYNSDLSFNYYHRYKEDGNKKLYLSSKYLKDNVINANNEITSVTDSISNIEAVSSGVCYLNNSFEFGRNGDSLLNIPNTTFQIDPDPITELCFGAWVNMKSIGSGIQIPLSLTVYGVARTFELWYNNTFSGNPGEKYSLHLGSSNSELNAPLLCPLNTYNYISVILKGGVTYFLINGIIQATTTGVNFGNYYYSMNIGRGNASQYYTQSLIDDILFSLGDSIIDPTGYSVGDKVFEPPRRGGFESEIKQYPIP